MSKNILEKIGIVLFFVGFFMLSIVAAKASPFNNFEDGIGLFNGRSHLPRTALGAKPVRWCGWYMRTQKGGGPEYNKASSWLHYGHATGPRVGAVVIWNSSHHHHVGLITGRTAQGWVVKSGNDGGAVRERVRSVAGAAFRI